MSRTLFTVALFILSSAPPVDQYFDRSMVGKAVIQQFSHIALGMLTAHLSRSFELREGYQKASGLVVFTFIFLFWSIPLSVDLSEVYWWMDQLYHLSMFLGGFLLYRSFRGLPNIFKGAYGLFFSSMLVATAYVYRTKDTLLCSTYTLEDQHLYGKILFLVGLTLYMGTVFWIVFKWGGRGGADRP